VSMDPVCSQSLPCSEASECGESSPAPVICEPEETYPSLQMCSAEMPHTETVKTWFQNQRMKSKRWQKNSWPRNTSDANQKASAPTYPSLYSSYHQGCLVNTNGNFPVWNNQTWSNSTWSNQTRNIQSWSNHSWNTQTWCTQSWNTQAWSSPFYNCGEDPLQSCMQFQPNSPASDLEAALETAGENHSVIQQTARYLSTPQTMDVFLNYSTNMQPEDV
uniref:Homeobox domain-containing protein n=1 Tax=Saimiri boliviensis boliviensis TaxID=39432 RepID=A0A2K6T6V1_SAIBB